MRAFANAPFLKWSALLVALMTLDIGCGQASDVGTSEQALQACSMDAATGMEFGDLTGDRKADIAFQQQTTGDVWAWKMNLKTHVGPDLHIGSPGSSWELVGGERIVFSTELDLVWQDKGTGSVTFWYQSVTQGVSTFFSSNLFYSPGAQWHVEALDDFNKDGQGDLLLRNTSTGQAKIVLMRYVRQPNDAGGLATWTDIPGGQTIGTVAPPWQIEGSAHFNQNATIGVVWHNTTTGAIWIWRIDNQVHTPVDTFVGNLGTAADPWRIGAIGEYSGSCLDDGVELVPFNQATGDVWIWPMQGMQHVGPDTHVGTVPGWYVTAP
jgi:hypothetical protein